MVKQEKVLFVVYRPEWWGCFDSLCRQECDKEHVTCYVMPIPRYERDMDTKVLDMTKKHFHPEWLTELPDKAILADFTTFSLDQRFDRIYIHNPYDNACAMDSVEPVYYSGNLKSKTDKLIYVPHMLYMGGMPESMVHCPVYDSVDAIWLSDERVRYSLDVAYDSKVEMVPCGILEYLDKLNAEKESEQSSAEISRKKRLLYCVSYEDLFYGTEKQIQKMWDIFKYMETREDVELVFRPDEDIPSRYFTLHPEICRKYKELVAYFKAKRIGTYDESPNPYRAAVDADGIMTTGHPMCAMFSVQGKYVLSIDRESRPIPTEEDRCVPSLWATTVVEKEDELEVWFVPDYTKLLCRMVIGKDTFSDSKECDKSNGISSFVEVRGKVEIVAEVPDEMLEWCNYIGIVRVNHCLYLIPLASRGIWKYDMKTGCFSEQYLPQVEGGYMSKAIVYGNYLYLIPRNYPGIVKYDTITEEMQVINGWVSDVEQYVEQKCAKEPYFIWAVKQEGNVLYMASSKCDVWVEFDLDNDTWQLTSMGIPGNRFINMVKDGDRVWLLPCDGNEIFEWNCVTKESKALWSSNKIEGKNVPYGMVIDIGEDIVIFPQQAEEILRISKGRENIIRKITEGVPCDKQSFLSEYLKQRKVGYQFVYKLRENRFLTYEFYDGAFCIFNEKLHILKKMYCRLPLKKVKEQEKKMWNGILCREENDGFLTEAYSLPTMVDVFVDCDQKTVERIRYHYSTRIKFC